MLCRYCGKPHPDEATVCFGCGHSLRPIDDTPAPTPAPDRLDVERHALLRQFHNRVEARASAPSPTPRPVSSGAPNSGILRQGSGLSPEEKQRIVEEERLRFETQEKLKTEARKKSPLYQISCGCLMMILGLLGLYIMWRIAMSAER